MGAVIGAAYFDLLTPGVSFRNFRADMKTTPIPKSTADTRMKKRVKDQKFALVKRLTSIKAKTKILKYRFTIFSIPVFVFHVSTFSILVLTVLVLPVL